MKKHLALFFALIVLISSFTCAFAGTTKYGDLNCDDQINIMDATAIQRHLAEIILLDEDTARFADVDGDGRIAIMDATTIQLYVAQIIDVFPAEQINPTVPTEDSTNSPTETPTVETTEPPTEVETKVYSYEYYIVTEEAADTLEFEVNFDPNQYSVKKFSLNNSALPGVNNSSIKNDSNYFKLPTQKNSNGFKGLTLSGTLLLKIKFNGPVDYDVSNIPKMTVFNISSENSCNTGKPISYKYIERFDDIIIEKYVGETFENTAPTFENTNISKYSPSDMALEVFEIVNQERAKAGVKPLEFGYFYYDCAKVRAEECTKYFSHDRPDGRKWSSVFDDLGVNTKYRWAGENIAANFTSAEATMVGFMNSPGHRENILRPEFEYVAIAVCENPDYPGYYYTSQLFYSNPDLFE